MITADKLFKACRYGKIDIVRQYIAEGGDVNAKNSHGETALVLSAWHGHINLIKELVAAGADVNARNSHDWTAFMYMMLQQDYETAQLLIMAGADIYIKDKYGYTDIEYCENTEIKALLIKLYQQRLNTEAAIASSESPEIIKGFDAEL